MAEGDQMGAPEEEDTVLVGVGPPEEARRTALGGRTA